MTVPEVSPEDGAQLVRDGAMLLDCRNDDEWAAGHAADATYVTLQQIPKAIDSLPRDRRIVAICRTGARSANAAQYLINQGFDAVNLAGGLRAWVAAGLPVVTDDGAAGTVI